MSKDEKNHEIEKKLKWINSVMELKKLKPTPLAQAGGISPATLTRFLKDPFNSRVPRDNTLDSMALKLDVPFYSEIDVHDCRGFADDGATPITPEQAENDKTLKTLMNSNNDPVSDAIITNFWIMRGEALENVGILDGDILEVDYHAEPKIGDIVCISLRDEENFTGKTVFRLLATQHPIPAAVMATNKNIEDTSKLATFIDGVNARVYGVVSRTFRNYR